MLVIGLLCIAISYTFFALDGWAYTLYWLYDHVYLYLKGHLWTRFCPISLIWILPLVAAAIYLYIRVCVRGPLWLSPHASAILVLSRFRPTRALLHLWCWLVGPRDWGWRFIYNVIEQEIENGFDGIVNGSVSPRQVDTLTELCLFPARLSRLASDAPAINYAVGLLFEALVLRRLYGNGQSVRYDRLLTVNLRKLLKLQPSQDTSAALDASSARRFSPNERERYVVDRLLAGAQEYLASGRSTESEEFLARQIRSCLEFSDTLDTLRKLYERERISYRSRGEATAEGTRIGSDRLRACLLYTYLLAHAAGEPALAHSVHTRMEGYLLAYSLAGLNSSAARDVFRSRDFSTLNRLLQPQSEQVSRSLNLVRELDESVFTEDDTLAPVRQADLLKLSAGWSEDG